MKAAFLLMILSFLFSGGEQADAGKGIVDGTPPPDAAAAYDLAVENAFAAFDGVPSLPYDACNHECEQCGISQSYHRNHSLPTGWDGTHQDEPFDCADASCPTPCGDPEEEEDLLDGEAIAGLWDAVRTDAIDVVVSTLALTDRAKFNSDRLAIQVTGCGGAIVAHIPLSLGQARTLSTLDQ